jgi:hypothetical protein
MNIKKNVKWCTMYQHNTVNAFQMQYCIARMSAQKNTLQYNNIIAVLRPNSEENTWLKRLFGGLSSKRRGFDRVFLSLSFHQCFIFIQLSQKLHESESQNIVKFIH